MQHSPGRRVSREEPISCTCEYSDAWRCAVAGRLSTVTCPCRCHRLPPLEVCELVDDEQGRDCGDAAEWDSPGVRRTPSR